MYKDDSRGVLSTMKLMTNTAMLINGYTIHTNYVNSNYEATFSNVYTLGNEVNKGYKIPTLLRIFGTLLPAEINTTVANLKLALITDRSV